jgi:hypothetical protein
LLRPAGIDRFRARAYMPGHVDGFRNNRTLPPPYRHGTGALWRVTILPVPPDLAAAPCFPSLP